MYILIIINITVISNNRETDSKHSAHGLKILLSDYSNKINICQAHKID